MKITNLVGIFRIQIRLYALLIALGFVILFTYLFATGKKVKDQTQPSSIFVPCQSSLELLRGGGFQFTKPLLTADLNSESEYMQVMKREMESYIHEVQTSQRASSVSVYFRRMNDGEYFTINQGQLYNPASMAKVMILITYLKDAEDNASVLNKRIFFPQHYSEGNQQNIVSFHLQEGAYYTVKQLMEYMIIHSDNDATALLGDNMNRTVYTKLFTDLNIPVPDDKAEYYISVTDFAKLFRILYNASYVREELSDYGLKLLSLSDYKDGLRRGIDSTVVMAHKFGERIIARTAQFHEFGIVYFKNDPYLIGVMTSGSNLKDLSDIVAGISGIACRNYKTLING